MSNIHFPSAYAGPQGSQGVKGDKGDIGSTGVPGGMGYQGYQGAAGPQGVVGDDGATGATGPQGNAGQNGPIGATGPQGTQGTQGNQGPQGTQGNQGHQGYQGNNGATGIMGSMGYQGYQGPQGYQGSVGSVGPQGPQGYQGVQGDPGGATGPQGYQGDAGPQGVSGGNGYGTLATRPDPTSVDAGFVYFVYDQDGGTAYVSTGTAWVQFSPAIGKYYANTGGQISGWSSNAINVTESVDIDWDYANIFSRTISTDTTFTFSNTKDGQSIYVRVKQDATGSWGVTWPGTILWPNRSSPTMSTAENSVDLYMFVQISGTVYGSYAQNYSA